MALQSQQDVLLINKNFKEWEFGKDFSIHVIKF